MVNNFDDNSYIYDCTDADKRTIIENVESTLNRTRSEINRAMARRQGELFTSNVALTSYEKNRLKVLKNIERTMYEYLQKVSGLER